MLRTHRTVWSYPARNRVLNAETVNISSVVGCRRDFRVRWYDHTVLEDRLLHIRSAHCYRHVGDNVSAQSELVWWSALSKLTNVERTC
jgi:hypothetical protein